MCGVFGGFSSPSYFPLFISVMGACLHRGMGSLDWVVKFCSLHLGAGCQQWKLQDVSGTQPPLSNAVVKSTSHQMQLNLAILILKKIDINLSTAHNIVHFPPRVLFL